jgi:heat shock protein HslJ
MQSDCNFELRFQAKLFFRTNIEVIGGTCLKKSGERTMKIEKAVILPLLRISLILSLFMFGSAFASQRSLAGSQWRLESFGKAGDERPVVDGTTISIQFGTDGRANGSSGCNSYSGTYNAEGDHISFGQMISTMRACVEPKANEQEQKYMAALRAVTRFEIGDTQLVLSDGGEVALNFNDQSKKNDQASANGPVDMLASYFSAINEREYRKAFSLWEHPTTTLAAFSRGYSDTQRVRFLVEQSFRIEGAAGSLFASVPTMIIARTKKGTEQLFAGCYVLRKSNVEEPPTGWHIHKALVSPVTQTRMISKLLFSQCTS